MVKRKILLLKSHLLLGTIHFSSIKDNILVLKIRFPIIVLTKRWKQNKKELIRSAFFLWHINITSSFLSNGFIISWLVFFFFFSWALNITFKKSPFCGLRVLQLFSGLSGFNLTRVTGLWHLFCHLLYPLKI